MHRYFKLLYQQGRIIFFSLTRKINKSKYYLFLQAFKKKYSFRNNFDAMLSKIKNIRSKNKTYYTIEFVKFNIPLKNKIYI